MAGDAVLEPSAVLDPSEAISLETHDIGPAARVIAIANQKGGVGKTTTAINLARAFSLATWRPKRPVLVVDFDPQGNTTTTLAADEIEDDQLSVADAIVPDADTTLDEVIVPTIWPNVWLAPAIMGPLTKAESLIAVAVHGREHRLSKAIEPVRKKYDIVIDLPPALGLLTINGLTAADLVQVVAEADQWSADGLDHLRTTVQGVQEYSNPGLRWGPVLLNRWRGTRSEAELRDEITEYFPEARVWDDVIPLWTKIKDTLNEGRGLDEGNARLRGIADCYDRLGRKLLEGAE